MHNTLHREDKFLSTPIKGLPTFIHVGPGRTATSMLYEVFKEHPQICMAKNTKETNFFNDEYRRGIGWYQSFFKECREAMAIGEISNTYIYDPDVPGRIFNFIPNVKIITVLRNPFDRINSAYNYRLRSGEIEMGLSIEEAITEYPNLVTQNFYGDQLKRFLRYFSKQQVLIEFYDDLILSPEVFIKRIFEFIGVDSSYRSKKLYNRINPTSNVRYKLIAPFIRRASDSLRRYQLHALLDYVKRSSLVNYLFFTTTYCTQDQNINKQRLYILLGEQLIPQINSIESLTGRDLTNWYT